MTLSPDIKKGSAELLILALIDERPRHGYEISQRIAERSNGSITFSSSTLYPVLHSLERRGIVRGRWDTQPGERRRRFYSITPAGRKFLDAQRAGWRQFMKALVRVARPKRAAL